MAEKCLDAWEKNPGPFPDVGEEGGFCFCNVIEQDGEGIVQCSYYLECDLETDEDCKEMEFGVELEPADGD